MIAGTYAKVVVDSYGRITSSAALVSGDITTALGFTPLQHNETITVSGDASGSGTGSIALTLANTGVIAGTYAKMVVNSKGLITSGASLTSSDITSALGFTPGIGNGSVTSVNASSTTLSISGGPVTSSGTLSINLNTVGTAGTYTKVVTDSYGRITSGSALSSGDVTTALGFTPLQHNETVTLSGDITGSGASSISASLSNTGVAAGTYTVSTIVVDSKGRITSASNGAVSGSGTVTSISTANSTNIITSGTNSVTTTGTFAFDLSNTGVTPGTYNYSTIVVDAKGRISNASSNSSSGGATFGVKKANTTVVSAATTLNFTGNGVTVTDQGSGIAAVNIPNNYEWVHFKYSGASPALTGGDAIQANSANVVATITNGSASTVQFVFSGYAYPPTSIAIMGQSYVGNTFQYTNIAPASPATRTIAGGGTSDSPIFFGSFTTITLDLAAGEVGVSTDNALHRPHVYVLFRF